MGFLDSLLNVGELKAKIDELESRIAVLESVVSPDVDKLEQRESMVLDVLTEPMSTEEVASAVYKSRSWASLVLNRLERNGKVREAGRRGRQLLYERVD